MLLEKLALSDSTTEKVLGRLHDVARPHTRALGAKDSWIKNFMERYYDNPSQSKKSIMALIRETKRFRK